MKRVVLLVSLAAFMAACKSEKPAPASPKATAATEAKVDPSTGCATAAKELARLCPSCALDPKAAPAGYDCAAAEKNVTYLRVLVENVGTKMPLKGQLVGTEWANLEARTKVVLDAAKKGCAECFDRPPPDAATGEACPACFARPYAGPFTVSYPDGKRRVVGAYAAGKLDGKVSTFFPNGIKSTLKTYRAGVLHGPFTEWDEGSRMTRTGTYDEGALHGEQSRFEATRVVERGVYQYGVRTGRWMKWYPSGKKRSQRSYQTKCEGRKCITKRHGVFIAWDEKGKIASLTQYADGKRVALDLKALKKGK